MKLCECGCGYPVPTARRTDPDRGYVKGQPIRFIKGHSTRKPLGEGRHTNIEGEPFLVSRVITEMALGKPLPARSIVHHVNEDDTDHRNGNLVACQDQAYHMLLHQRMRAYKECGHANYRKCLYCKKYDNPNNLFVRSNRSYHRACHARAARERKSNVSMQILSSRVNLGEDKER